MPTLTSSQTIPYCVTFDRKRTYYDAAAFCKAKNMTLISVTTELQSAHVFNCLYWKGHKRAWIGAHRRFDTVDEPPFEFKYENGQKVVPDFWGPEEPNNFRKHAERCVEVRVLEKNNAKINWNDAPCVRRYPFVCMTRNENQILDHRLCQFSEE